jgi:hypothetical protein
MAVDVDNKRSIVAEPDPMLELVVLDIDAVLDRSPCTTPIVSLLDGFVEAGSFFPPPLLLSPVSATLTVSVSVSVGVAVVRVINSIVGFAGASDQAMVIGPAHKVRLEG